MSDGSDYYAVLDHKLKAKPRWHKDDRKTAYEIDRAAGNSHIQHGTEGHTGFRCKECADLSGVTHSIYDFPNDDLWQQKQIDWQEQCDAMFRAFDDSVAAHFPTHTGPQCQSCPQTPPMPAKPVRPYERQ